MGDRTGLKKLDRTNGYEDGNNYMAVKKSKLAEQNDQIRDAIRQRNSTSRTDLFKGISICVNGRTQPTADELKRLILLNGGDYHPYYRYQTTKFMVATNLSIARMKQLRPDDRIVRPEWITDSIQVNCLLPYEDYQLFVEEPRGRNGSVLPIDLLENNNSNSVSNDTDQNQLVPVAESYSRSYRDSRQRAAQQKADLSKSRDIREMFSRSVRSISNGAEVKQKSSEVISLTDSSMEDLQRGSGPNMNSSDNPAEVGQDDDFSNPSEQIFDEQTTDTLDALLLKLAKPIKCWDPAIEAIQSNLCGIIKQIGFNSDSKQISGRTLDEDQPYYILLVGDPGAGQTTLAANMAAETKFPFIRIYQARATASRTESAKVQYMKKLFDDAARSELSCIVIDGLEVILDYCHIGPRFSNTSRAVFTESKNSLPEGHRMLVICTVKYEQFLNDLMLWDAFDCIIRIPSLTRPEQVGTALRELYDTSFTPDEIEELIDALGSIQFRMGIKKLERLIRDAAFDPPELRVKMFLDRMHMLQLTRKPTI